MFIVSFLSVHIFGLFIADIIGATLALMHFKWQESHPDITMKGNVLKMTGSLYYGSLPVVESMYAQISSNYESVILDMSDIFYQDADADRWISAMKNNEDVTIIPSKHN